jgi:hypothetical protein
VTLGASDWQSGRRGEKNQILPFLRFVGSSALPRQSDEQMESNILGTDEQLNVYKSQKTGLPFNMNFQFPSSM